MCSNLAIMRKASSRWTNTSNGIVCFIVLIAPSVWTQSTAAQTSVVVLGVNSTEGDDAVAHEVSAALRRAATQVRGWNVGAREINLSQVEIAAGCEVTEPGCLAQLSEALSSQKILYGSLRRSRNTGRIDYELTLRLFDARNGAQREERISIGANQTDVDALREPMRGALQRLTSAVPPVPANTARTPTPTPPNSTQTGTLDVQSDGLAGDDVRVDGVSVGTLNRNGRLVATGISLGVHRVQIVRSNRVLFDHTSEIAASNNTLQAAVVPEANAIAIEPAPSAPGHDNTLEIVGWTLVGVGVAALAGMFVTWGRIRGIQDDNGYRLYQRDVPRNLDVCAVAATQSNAAAGITSLCNEASMLETLQYAFLVPASVTLGVGAAILIIDRMTTGRNEEQHALRIAPSFSTRGGSLTLSGSF